MKTFCLMLGRAVLATFWLLGTTLAITAQERGALDVSTNESGTEISQFLSFLQDETKSLTIDQILTGTTADDFTPLGKTQQFSRAHGAFWFRLDLKNSADYPIEKLLVIGYPNLQNISFFDIDAQTGTLRERHRIARSFVNEVDVRYRLPIYRISVEAGEEKSIYLSIISPTIRTGMKLWDAADFIESGQVSEWWFMVFVGVVLAASLYLLVITIVTRSRLYGALFLVAVMLVLLQFTMHGHAYMLFRGVGGAFNLSWLLIQAWTAAAVVTFSYIFLGGDRLPRVFRFGLLGLVAAFVVVGLVSLFDYIAAMRFEQPLIIGGAPFLIAATVYQIIRRNKDAVLFLACWVPILILSVLVNLNGAGIIGSPQLGTIFAAAWIPTTIVFFVFSVIFRARAEKRESDDKSTFLAILSHEVRTPLTGILGTVELLKETPLNARQNRLIENLSHSGKALLSLLNDVLELSKFQAGKAALNVAPTNPTALVESMVALMSPRAAEKGVKISIHYDCNIPEIVLTDESRLRQVLLNLLSNAVKFTEKGNIFVRLIGLGEHAGKTRLRFEVEDEGIGIPQNKQDALFSPFTQLDGSSSRQYEGTGLGLSICKELVALMGGEIELCSEPGKGSCFSFELVAEKVEPRSSAEASNEAGSLRNANGLALLIVDDTPMNRDVIGDLMRSQGYRVRTAASGGEALTILEKENFDAVILDAFMPGMSGLDVVAKLREKGNFIPVVGLTAAVDSKLVNECRKKGMNAVLHKPIQAKVLSDTVMELVRKENLGKQRALVNTHILDSYAASLGADRLLDHVDKFRKGGGELMETLRNEIIHECSKEQAKRCHKLASNAAMFGLDRLGTEAETLAAALRSGVKQAITSEEFEKLNQLLSSSYEDLDEYFSRLTERP